MERRNTRCLLWIMVCVAMALGSAGFPTVSVAVETDVSGLVNSAHPDQLFLQSGVDDLHRQRYHDALHHLELAAYYASKPAQYLIGLIYLHGRGVAKDPARAYAWLDLAAQRGYQDMLVTREQTWRSLSAAQRKQALTIGKTLYAKYADKVAKPRLDGLLRMTYRNAVGSHTGFTAEFAKVFVSCGYERLCYRPHFYDAQYWLPKSYWKEQDALWNGRVTVGPLQQVRDGQSEAGKPEQHPH